MLDISMLPIPYRRCFESAYLMNNLVRFHFSSRLSGQIGIIRAKSVVLFDKRGALDLIFATSICDMANADKIRSEKS